MNKFESLISNETSKVHELIQHRIDNEDWLKISMHIAVKILDKMRKDSITKEQLCNILDMSIEDIEILLKGHKDITLKEICKIEKFLNIQLIH